LVPPPLKISGKDVPTKIAKRSESIKPRKTREKSEGVFWGETTNQEKETCQDQRYSRCGKAHISVQR